jgi:HSP20 family molecular chaperone IbpA
MAENRNGPAARGQETDDHIAVPLHNIELENERLRRPLVETMETRESVIILVEIHGYRAEDMKIRTNGSQLNILASSENNSWNSTLTLPTAIDPRGSVARYNNGTLEVTLRKGYYNLNGFVLLELV